MLATSPPVTIGKWAFHTDTLLLECADKKIKLEPRVAYLLYCLAEKAGVPISRAELMERVWSGMVVGDEALTGAINKLRSAFGDDSHHPEVIKTIPKVGYQLIADVEFSPSRGPVDNPELTPAKKYIFAGFAVISLFIVAGTFFLLERPGTYEESRPALELPDKPSIAVLPFTNMSDDPQQEYFVDGMTEDLITDISKIPDLFVIARNSVFTYKGKVTKVGQVAEELGVRYVLEGSVRRAGDQVRINAQLIDATTGGHIWADRYDGTYEDVFALQDKVTSKIVATLAIKLTEIEQDQITHRETDNTAAYDFFLKGWEQYLLQTPESFRRAITLFEKAVELDPGYSRAYAALAATYWQVWKRYWHRELGMESPHDPLFRAEEYLVKAQQAPTSLALQVATAMLSQQGRHDEALAEGDRAITFDPNDANGYVALAGAYNLAGQPGRARGLVEKAIRLNPHFPPAYLYELGLAQFGEEDFDNAAVSLDKATTLNPDDRWSLRLLIATDGHLGRTRDAAKATKWAESSWGGLDPLNIGSVTFWYPFKERRDLERLVEGLQKAGVPK